MRKKSDLDYHIVSPDISSPANIWNISDDEIDEDESISNDFTLYSENICFVISSFWNEGEQHINTDVENNCHRQMRVLYSVLKHRNRQYSCIHKHRHQLS